MTNTSLNLNNCFLSRNLDILDKNGKATSQVTIIIGRPEKADNTTWECSYAVIGLDEINPCTFRVLGVDGVQALLCAFNVLEGLLSGTDIAKEGRLSWNDRKSDFLGQPKN